MIGARTVRHAQGAAQPAKTHISGMAVLVLYAVKPETKDTTGARTARSAQSVEKLEMRFTTGPRTARYAPIVVRHAEMQIGLMAANVSYVEIPTCFLTQLKVGMPML
jgi:hypothetical protein